MEYMNKNNLNNIQSKLHVEECAAVEICNGAIEDDYQLTEKETKMVEKDSRQVGALDRF
jgi:hypothetical protein